MFFFRLSKYLVRKRSCREGSVSVSCSPVRSAALVAMKLPIQHPA